MLKATNQVDNLKRQLIKRLKNTVEPYGSINFKINVPGYHPPVVMFMPLQNWRTFKTDDARRELTHHYVTSIYLDDIELWMTLQSACENVKSSHAFGPSGIRMLDVTEIARVVDHVDNFIEPYERMLKYIANRALDNLAKLDTAGNSDRGRRVAAVTDVLHAFTGTFDLRERPR